MKGPREECSKLPYSSHLTPLPTQAADNQTPEEQLPEPPREPERPGLLATIVVFVTSFFTSLLPQQPPELQMN